MSERSPDRAAERPPAPYSGDLTFRGDLSEAARPPVGKRTLIGTRSIRRLLLEEMAMARRANDGERFRQAWQELAYISIPAARKAAGAGPD